MKDNKNIVDVDDLGDIPDDDNNNNKPNTKKSKEKDFTEDDILNSFEMPPDLPNEQVVDPLIESEPIVKEYSKPDVIGDINNVADIPEEIIDRPTINLNETEGNRDAERFVEDIRKNSDKDNNGGNNNNNNNQQGGGKQQKAEPTMGNPDLEGASKKEKSDGSGHLAETIVDGYEMLHNIALATMMKTDEKLMKQALKGKIELDVIDSEIQVGSKVFQIRKLLYDYNMNLQNVLTVEQSFKDKSLPLLKSVLAKHNIGMTEEQRLAALLVKDIQPKLVQVIQLNSTMNDILKKGTFMIRKNKEQVTREQAETIQEPIIIEQNHYEPEEVPSN